VDIKLIAKKIDCEYVGDINIDIDSIVSPSNPQSNSIVFIPYPSKFSEKNYKLFKVILTSDKQLNLLNGQNILYSSNPRLSFAKLTNLLKPIEPEVVTAEDFSKSSSNIGKNFRYGKNVYISLDAKIGDDVFLGSNVVIGSKTVIGNQVNIDSGTVISSQGFGNVQDSNNQWTHIYHQGGVIIGSNVSIGASCCIDKATLDFTIIESGVIIDNLVHIAHNVTIGENTAIAAKVGIAGSCEIGKRNMIGGMVGIVDHIKTTNDVVISATSSVTMNLMEPGVYTGIMPISKHSSWKRIAFWITKLDKIAKFLNLKKI